MLDNGQHILIGAYRATLGLMQAVGVAPAQACLDAGLDLEVRPAFRLRAPHLPAPLHLLVALLGARGIGTVDKLNALVFLHGLRLAGFRLEGDMPLTRFLQMHRQGAAICARLWFPLCLAALNTPPGEASAQVFVNVLRDTLFGPAAASRLLLPRRDLGRLLPEPAAVFLRAHGARLRLGARVRSIRREGGILLVDDGTPAAFSQVICAVPPHRLGDVLADLPALKPLIEWAQTLDYQPIYTVYLQYDEPCRLPRPMIGLERGLAQWVFDRGALGGPPGLMAAVISARGPHQALSHDALAQAVARELADAFGWPETPRWQQVIAEKRATFSCRPQLARPDNVTAEAGLFLAGDYIASPYPATLEAAVRSGVQCARLVLEQRP